MVHCETAAIAYLAEWNWQANSLIRWTRPATDYMLENEISIQDPWWKIDKALLLEARSQRITRLAQRQHHDLLTGLVGMCTVSKSSGCQKSIETTSKHGSRVPYTTERMANPSYAPFAAYPPHQSTLRGCANGTMPEATNPCLQNGPKGSLNMTRSPCGMLRGYLLNHKNTSNSSTNAKDMARGRIFMRSNRTNTKGGHSPWMLRPLHMTREASCGCLVFVYTLCAWNNCTDLAQSQGYQHTRRPKPGRWWQVWLHLPNTPATHPKDRAYYQELRAV